MGKEEGGVHIYLFIYFVFIYLSFHMQDLCSWRMDQRKF